MSHQDLFTNSVREIVNVNRALKRNPDSWQNFIGTVHSYVSNIDQSGVMFDNARLEERLQIIDEVQEFAYFDTDNGGIEGLANWCVREWNRIKESYPDHVGAFEGHGRWWLLNAQQFVAKIASSEESDEEDSVADRRRGTENYYQARVAFASAVSLFKQSEENAKKHHCLTGKLLELKAEACISLGNVSPTRDSRPHFEVALDALRAAERLQGYTLPAHLTQYLREHEYVLR
ncbi:hypothetical protein B9Z19DRAFT_1095110 [Tuber borchii]|uniref:Uncharacterized protein n=1 Tax=Tuber borchii TaxID=42251 RepID=A0A2T6ZD28_TUBBO|nr:hypothetical protein B9Z19DRAFT_1095110 [Tuber borchii]